MARCGYPRGGIGIGNDADRGAPAGARDEDGRQRHCEIVSPVLAPVRRFSRRRVRVGTYGGFGRAGRGRRPRRGDWRPGPWRRGTATRPRPVRDRRDKRRKRCRRRRMPGNEDEGWSKVKPVLEPADRLDKSPRLRMRYLSPRRIAQAEKGIGRLGGSVEWWGHAFDRGPPRRPPGTTTNLRHPGRRRRQPVISSWSRQLDPCQNRFVTAIRRPASHAGAGVERLAHLLGTVSRYPQQTRPGPRQSRLAVPTFLS